MSAFSEIALWVIVLGQGLIILGLMREIGLIQLRIGPAIAMASGDQGLRVGTVAPVVSATDLRGQTFAFGGGREFAQLIVFASPACGVCHELLGPIAVLAKAERELIDVVLVCGAKVGDCIDFLGDLPRHCRVALDPDGEIKKTFLVSGSSFALVVDRNGLVGQSGVVNSLQHLESLLVSLNRDGEIVFADQNTPPVTTTA